MSDEITFVHSYKPSYYMYIYKSLVYQFNK